MLTNGLFRGEHIHYEYFLESTDTKELAQVRLVGLLVTGSGLLKDSSVLSVGCGIGGTSQYVAKNHSCKVIGIMISGRQVEIAQKLTLEAAKVSRDSVNGSISLGDGSVRFMELDTKNMSDYFTSESSKATFDCV